ncbi:hypothetical protein [Kiloniella sp. b19]|uniref:hypothetical protein n=1 Tax=Kiloniella sp. GXU_MW_B19 TaxID=3141326 RepID=UPI0031D94CE1
MSTLFEIPDLQSLKNDDPQSSTLAAQQVREFSMDSAIDDLNRMLALAEKDISIPSQETAHTVFQNARHKQKLVGEEVERFLGVAQSIEATKN